MEFRNCVENRRSIRSFRPDPVRREDILYCLDAARLSPSSLNCQPWRFVVLDDPQLKNRAASYISNPLLKSNLHARQAPVLIAVVSDLSGNPNPLYRTAVKKFGMYQYDLGAAVQTLCLAAADLGLGSCIMSTIRNKKQLQDLLGIPQGQEICLVVALGYPDGDPAASRERLSLEEICCFSPGIPAERPDDPSRSWKTAFRTQKRRLAGDAFFIAFPNPLRHGH